MGKIKKINVQSKKFLVSFLGEIFNIAVKVFDELDLTEHDGLLAAFPFGKVVSFIIKKGIVIKNVDKAFNQLYRISYMQCLFDAFQIYQINNNVEESVIKRLTESLKKEFKASEFDIKLFHENEIETYYKEQMIIFFKEAGIDERVQATLFRFIHDNLKIIFWQISEKLSCKFENFNHFIDSKSYQSILEKNKLDRYYTGLYNEYTAPVFNNERQMSLADIYIKPGFKLHSDSINKEKRKDFFLEAIREDFYELKKEIFTGSLHEYLYEILKGKQPEYLRSCTYRIIFLLGYPGQGKSSFCKRVITDFRDIPDKHLYFLKFRDIIDPQSLINTPLKTIKDRLEELNNITIPDDEFKNSFLVLDELDELAMKEKMDLTRIDVLCKELVRLVSYSDFKNIRILITSRYGYIRSEHLRKEDVLIFQLTEFDLSQQKIWLSSYRKFYPETVLNNKTLDKFNTSTTFSHLRELISQPILLHMITSLNKEITTDMDRTEIYDMLFSTLIKRKWAKDEHILYKNKINKKDLRNFLKSAAFAIYNSEYEYIHKKDLLSLIETKQFIEKINPSDLDKTVKGVLISFYFREVRQEEEDEYEDRNSRYAIEFLHKSLYEYLTAEKIWDDIQYFTDKQNRRDEYVILSCDNALKFLSGLFSSKLLSIDVAEYLIQIIQKADINIRKHLADRLEYFLPELCEKEFLFSFNCEMQNKPIEKATNIFHGYWTILIQLVPKRNYLQKEKRPLQLFRYLMQRKFTSEFIIYFCYQDLYFVDFYGANLYGANLYGANLEGANLGGTILYGANLGGANLWRANLKGAILEEANLGGANLEEANLGGANLGGANLEGANLEGANLYGANLYGANLEGAILKGANLEGANLYGANLGGANLWGANLKGAILEEANLGGAKLTEANLGGANLKGAILDRANLEGAIFSCCDLSKIHGLTIEQISKCKIFKNCKFPPALDKKIRKQFPQLISP